MGSTTLALIEHVELFALLPAASLIISVAVAGRFAPSDKTRSALQHFAAGVVFSTVAVELLPDLMRSQAVLSVVLGFAAGVALLLFIRVVSREPAPSAVAAEPTLPGFPKGMLVAVGIDILLDGLLIGLGFSVGAKEGWMITIALALELISLGLAVGATLAPFGPRRSAVVSVFLGGALLLGAGSGVAIIPRLSPQTLAAVLAFGSAALMFLATEELLVEAHETGETVFATAMFFAGFILFLAVGMIS